MSDDLTARIDRLGLRSAATNAIEAEVQSLLAARIGPAEFSAFGRMVAVRCPEELAPLLRKAGAMWEPGGKRWLVHRNRLGPLVRNLRRETDPLFRRAGIDLDRAP